MKRFEELEVLGNGGFGTVIKCRDRGTGDLIAIKKLKQRFASFDDCLQLKEVKSLRKLKHVNVVRLLQVFRENECLYLVFELLGKSLLHSINSRGAHSESDVRAIMSQILAGLAHVHRQGFFHRDMKPDNLLWKDDVLKIADFGLAREIRSRPPFTEYCGTRWYRAPEILLRSEFYNSPVDIWASGAIMAELFTGSPIFQGTSETDQIYKIFGILGIPTAKTWPEGVRLANRLGIRFPSTTPTGLSAVLGRVPPAALDLISQMLRFDPARRPSAAQALQHDFFRAPVLEARPAALEHETRATAASAPEKSLDEILSTFVKMGTPDTSGHASSGRLTQSQFDVPVPKPALSTPSQSGPLSAMSLMAPSGATRLCEDPNFAPFDESDDLLGSS
jgi:protein kinase